MAFGRLERTEGARPISDINVTPLVDVMLVLVVILLVTAPLMASSLRLDLPQAEGAQPSDTPRFVTVGLDAAGRTFFNDQPVTPEQLAQRLAEAARQGADTEVQLRADQAVPYGRVVAVMGAAQKAGLNRIGFVAEPGSR
ncbi:MAG TPA: biopolymer transporter ExbD [Ramlibacter sp.]|jgi:biopolymer transport protein TolR|uniref:ExbD/TolR family protein n=1 Tax=Ramlibacter sp. TaxID=1917967 RepID=UPI002D43E83A|nr:biopolymer transporter ExbD [Ramlibacter sp.]HZY17261.1 biopolymer transporter ExbD [Ramlibacter sp.]